MGRWKLTGVPVETGIAGAHAFLEIQQWDNVDMIYVAENQLMFLSHTVGETEAMHCQFDGIRRQLKFKATNAKA